MSIDVIGQAVGTSPAHLIASAEVATSPHGLRVWTLRTVCGQAHQDIGVTPGKVRHPSQIYRAMWCRTCRPAP